MNFSLVCIPLVSKGKSRENWSAGDTSSSLSEETKNREDSSARMRRNRTFSAADLRRNQELIGDIADKQNCSADDTNPVTENLRSRQSSANTPVQGDPFSCLRTITEDSTIARSNDRLPMHFVSMIKSRTSRDFSLRRNSSNRTSDFQEFHSM